VYPRSGLAPAPVDRTAELNSQSGPITSISSFGEDADGELYIVAQGGGAVYRIIDPARTPPDCNGNGVDDGLERCRGRMAACCGSHPTHLL
jgi:hypothetical protein